MGRRITSNTPEGTAMETRGRPTIRTDEITTAICSQIADGMSLRAICEADDMPGRETVRRWLNDDEIFRGQYARAREEQADHYADEIVSLADNAEDPQKARLQIDARKWVASKLKHKAYGEKVTNEHTGADGGPIVLWGGAKST